MKIILLPSHSSCFIQLDGKRILIDPILSDYAAPFSFINRAFDGTNIYKPEDSPEIDSLLISHADWDEPFIRATEASFRLVTPQIGELLTVDAPVSHFPA